MVFDRFEMRNCPECDVHLKVKNLPRHMKRIHGIEIGHSPSEIERAFDRKNKGMLARFKNNAMLLIGFTIIVTIILGVSIYYGVIYEGSETGPGFRPAMDFPIIIDDEGMEEDHRQVKIPLNEITDEAKFYSYNSKGVEIRVFALLGSDDKPRVAFDASENSYSHKRGFRQDGNKMVDNAGNWEIDIDTIGVLSTNNERVPAAMEWEYCCQKQNVAINITDLNANRHMFE